MIIGKLGVRLYFWTLRESIRVPAGAHEPENGTRWTGHIGRVQSVFQDGALEDALGDSVIPDQTHVFVSGNPEMVEDLEDKLIERGFNLHNRITYLKEIYSLTSKFL